VKRSLLLVVAGALALGSALATAAERDRPAPPANDLPGRSVYRLDATWTTSGGRPFRLVELRGHPVVALLFYGTCQTACPLLVRDLHKLDASLPPSARPRVRYLLVTFDPERDTPEQLARFASEHGMDAARWTLLHGAPEAVRELAAALDVRYRATGTGEFSHDMRITLLDADGVIAAKSDGGPADLEALAERTAALAAPPPE
jgi:protein SCO1/2